MFTRLKDAFSNKDLRIKILLTVALVIVFRLGCWLPNPCFDLALFKESVSENQFLSLLSSISGGALANASLLALGVSPYISSEIIVQLLTVAIPALEKLAKSGEDGKQKISKITKFVALILATAQAIGIVVAYSTSLNLALFGFEGTPAPTWVVGTIAVVILVAGSMFTFWLGEKVTEYGIGNGLSVLIFVGILSSAGTAIYESILNLFSTSSTDREIWRLIIFVVVLVLIFGSIVAFESAERRIKVQYAKQIKGRKVYGGQSNYIPMKLMGTGVMPIIFASSILTFPQLLFSIFWPKSGFFIWYTEWMGAGSYLYSVVVSLLILFFAYFYAQISFNPDDVAKQIQQNGGFIPGFRQGRPTAEYLTKIQKRVTLFGALFLALITVVPSIVFKAIGSTSSLVNAFTATGMVIIVSVALEIDKQLEAQLMIKSYKGFLK
ncbi:MAG: preprotein translocase subunit SecY [Clostridia bacterium]|nr:preprotein translocase subunit SecY [Clostridia bacterium]